MTAPRTPRPRRFRVTVRARDLRYGDEMLSGPLAGYMVAGVPLVIADDTSVLVPLPGRMSPRQLPAADLVKIARYPSRRDEQLVQLVAARDAVQSRIDTLVGVSR